MDATHAPQRRQSPTYRSHATVRWPATRHAKIVTLLALAGVAGSGLLLAPPVTRAAAYYQFADSRTLLGVPHFMDVVSGLPWLPVGILGLLFVARTRQAGRTSYTWRGAERGGAFADGHERAAFAVLFGAIALLALGSGYFHLAPSPGTLVSDRLPMAVVFMSLFAIVLRERIGGRVARGLFVPLVALGIGSVLYWHYTEVLGRGDERLYGLVQFFPMVALPIVLVWFPAGASRNPDLFVALGWYAVAKLFELTDSAVFALTNGVISGHTLKHACAVVGSIWLLRVVLRRGEESPVAA